MPDVLADRYELGDVIGAGGMARVYRATDRYLDRQVAVKLLDDAAARSADPATHARFLNEARSAASFSHPNAVGVYDAGEHDGNLFIVMELVSGETLAQVLARDHTLPIARAVEITVQILGALDAMHSKQIVHRDVKPSNVLLNADGRVKLTDFGIAKRLDEIDEALTSAGMVIGTPRYLAPEQAVGGDINAATDVYLAGAVLFEMLTGSRPSTALAGATSRIPDPRNLRPDVPARVADTVVKALSFRPEERFASARAMSEGLQSGDTPVAGAASETDDADAATGEMTAIMSTTRQIPATEVMPAGDVVNDDADHADDGADADDGFQVRTLYAVLGVIAAVLLVAMAATLLDGGDGGGDGPTVEADEVVGPAEFLRRLEDDPGQFGKRGADLRDELDDVLAEADPERRAAAEEALRVDIFVWVAEGDLDTSVGALVESVLDR